MIFFKQSYKIKKLAWSSQGASWELVTVCVMFITKICQKYLDTWMKNYTLTSDRPTPLPMDPTWYKCFNSMVGNPDAAHQAQLAKRMQINYCAGIGELIWAMTMTRPDLA
jgi:hypothetical protein